MSVALLTQRFEETRRLAIAGCQTAPSHPRLKKLLPPLRQAGGKSTVFVRIAEAVTAVIESDDQTSAPALLALTGLINAAVSTQLQAGRKGTLQPVRRIAYDLPETQASQATIRPLLKALRGSRYQDLYEMQTAFEQGLFRDFRLMSPAVAVLEEQNEEMAEFLTERILPAYGLAVLPYLAARFDPCGGDGAARRLRIIGQIDPAGQRDRIAHALADGSEAVQIVAAGLLGMHPDDPPLLIEQLQRSDRPLIRRAALNGLMRSSAPDAVGALTRLLEREEEIPLLAAAMFNTPNSALIPAIVAKLHTLVRRLIATPPGTLQPADPLPAQIYCLLLTLRRQAAAEAFLLELWDDRERLQAAQPPRSGPRLIEALASLLSGGSEPLQRRLIADHATLPGEEFRFAVHAAFHLLTPEEVFEEFSRYATDHTISTKHRKTAAEKSADSRQAFVLTELLLNQLHRRQAKFHPTPENAGSSVPPADSRWLEIAFAQQNLNLLHTIARPGHAKLNEFLWESYGTKLRNPDSPAYEFQQLLESMVMAEHPQAADAIATILDKAVRQGSPHLILRNQFHHLIAALPPELSPRFEALVADLPPESAGELADAVETLKTGAAAAHAFPEGR